MNNYIEFNINNRVQVKLTEQGRHALRENYDKLKADLGGKVHYDFAPPKEDTDGWSTWQAWQLMEELGPHIRAGQLPFETTIRIETNNHC